MTCAYTRILVNMKDDKDPGMTSVEMETAIHEINLHVPRNMSRLKNWTPQKIKDWEKLEADIRQAGKDGYDTVTTLDDD